MDNSTSVFSVIKYNLHGLNQGSSLLRDLCEINKYYFDCICVQEHWLSPANLSHVVNFSPDYTFYGMSAMELKLNSGVLRGRPFGGVGILLKNIFCKDVIFYEANENFVLLKFSKLVIISIYLPCSSVKNGDVIACQVLEQIRNLICPSENNYVICSGDYNANLVQQLDSGVNDFIIDFELVKLTPEVLPNSVNFTYANDSWNHFSIIDHILVSKAIVKNVADCSIMDSAINLSDHNPVLAKFSFEHSVFDGGKKKLNNFNEKVSVKPVKVNLRWDHAIIENYYAYTFDKFNSIWNDLNTEENNISGVLNEILRNILISFIA